MESTDKKYTSTLYAPLIDGAMTTNKDALPSTEEPVYGNTTPGQTFLNIVKSFVGAGSFALPWALTQSGLVGGVVGILVLAFLANYTMKTLLHCKWTMIERRGFYSAVSYSDLGREAAGGFGYWLVYAFVLMTNLGVCAAYVSFCQDNARAFIVSTWDVSSDSIEPWMICCSLFPFLLVLCWLEDFKWLSPFALLGTVALGLGFGFVFYWGFAHFDRFESLSHYKLFNYKDYLYFYGAACFLFCTHTMTLPLEGSMKKPKTYPRVLDFSFLLVGSVNVVFAAFGYMLFPHSEESIIIQNFQSEVVFLNVIRGFLILEIVVTFPVVLMPVTQYVEGIVLSEERTTVRFISSKVIRFLLCAIPVGLASSTKQFQLVAGLVGAFTTSTTAFILPPFLRLLICWKSDKYTVFQKLADVGILTCGVPLAGAATYVVLDKLVKEWSG